MRTFKLFVTAIVLLGFGACAGEHGQNLGTDVEISTSSDLDDDTFTEVFDEIVYTHKDANDSDPSEYIVQVINRDENCYLIWVDVWLHVGAAYPRWPLGENVTGAQIHGVLDGKPLFGLMRAGSWEMYHGVEAYSIKGAVSITDLNDRLSFEVSPNGIVVVRDSAIEDNSDAVFAYMFGETFKYSATQPVSWTFLWDEGLEWTKECRRVSVTRSMTPNGDLWGYTGACDDEILDLEPHVEPMLMIGGGSEPTPDYMKW